MSRRGAGNALSAAQLLLSGVPLAVSSLTGEALDKSGGIYVPGEVRRKLPDGQPVAITGGASVKALLVEPANGAVVNWGAGAPTIATVYPVQTTGASAGKPNAVSRNVDPTLTTVAAGAGYSGVPLSRTGMNAMVQVTPDTNATAVIFRTLLSSGAGQCSSGTASALQGSPLNIGMWIWIPFLPQANVGGSAATPTIQLQVTAANGGTGGTIIGWNNNQLKEGWNFLKFVDTRGTIAAGAHPLGVSATFSGDANDPFLAANNGAVRRVVVLINNLSGVPVIIDSIWTGISSKAAVVLGCDASGVDLSTYAAPRLATNGLPFYMAIPRSVQTSAYSGTVDRVAVVADYTALGAGAAAAVAAGAHVCNHTMTHVQASASNTMGSLTTPQDILYEVMAWQAWARASGMPERGNEFYAAPQGSWSRLSEETIKQSGVIKMQRCWPQYNTPRTPWGIPNPHVIGSLDMGDQTYAGCYTALQSVLNVIEIYGDTLHTFWHVVQTAGDTGDLSAKTGNALNIYQSSFNAFADDIGARVAAGRMQALSPSQWYYGSGA